MRRKEWSQSLCKVVLLSLDTFPPVLAVHLSWNILSSPISTHLSEFCSCFKTHLIPFASWKVFHWCILSLPWSPPTLPTICPGIKCEYRPRLAFLFCHPYSSTPPKELICSEQCSASLWWALSKISSISKHWKDESNLFLLVRVPLPASIPLVISRYIQCRWKIIMWVEHILRQWGGH